MIFLMMTVEPRLNSTEEAFPILFNHSLMNDKYRRESVRLLQNKGQMSCVSPRQQSIKGRSSKRNGSNLASNFIQQTRWSSVLVFAGCVPEDPTKWLVKRALTCRLSKRLQGDASVLLAHCMNVLAKENYSK